MAITRTLLAAIGLGFLLAGCIDSDKQGQETCLTAHATPIYKEPDLNSPAITRLPRGTQLLDGQLVSAHMVKTSEEAAMPFVYVSTTDRKFMGWVHGSALVGRNPPQTQLLRALWVSRAWLGNDLTAALQNYRRAYRQHPAEPQVVVTGDSLAALVSELINQAAQARHAEAAQTDFLVFKELLPGFVPHVYNGRLHLWRQWQMLKRQAAAAHATGTLAWCDVNMAYWGDTVSFAYPQWILEDSGQLFNLLGDGKQLAWLKAVEDAGPTLLPFRSALNRLRHRLYDDLINPHTMFWYDQQKLWEEYNGILNYLKQRPEAVTKSTMVALEVRQAHLQKPDIYGVPYNRRTVGSIDTPVKKPD